MSEFTDRADTDRASPAAPRPPWCTADVWPFDLRTTTVDGHEITYTDHGPTDPGKPVLVFVHTGMWSFVFREVLVRLGTRHRCITLDFPGHGPEPGTGRALPDPR